MVLVTPDLPPDIAIKAYNAQKPDTPLVSISNEQAMRTAEQEAQVKTFGNREQAAFDANQSIIDYGTQAQNTIPAYSMALRVLDTVDTGFGTDTKMKLQGLLNSLGIKADIVDLPKLEMLYPAIAAGIFEQIAQTKGAISQKEMEVFEKFGTSFGKTTAGNKMLLRYKLASAQRAVKAKDLALRLRDTGGSAAEVRRKVDAFITSNDLSESLFDEVKEQDGLKYGRLPDGKTMVWKP